MFQPRQPPRGVCRAARGKWFVVLDGAPGPAYDDCFGPVFPPNGKLDYLAVEDGVLYRVSALPHGA
ncbi:MAG: hypothetical protein ABFE08_16420 [Armatimonadia bacterium]